LNAASEYEAGDDELGNAVNIVEEEIGVGFGGDGEEEYTEEDFYHAGDHEQGEAFPGIEFPEKYNA
jgi:hypothetical protein